MHTDTLNGQRRVGYLEHWEWEDKIKEFKAVNERIAVLRLIMRRKLGISSSRGIHI